MHPFIPLPCCWVNWSWNSCTNQGVSPFSRVQISTNCCVVPVFICHITKSSWAGARNCDVSVDMVYLIFSTAFSIATQCSGISVLLGINISEVSVWVSIIEMAKMLARNHREEVSSVKKMPGGKYYLHGVQNYRNIMVCKFLDRCPGWQLLQCKFHSQPDLQKHRSVILARCDLVEILDDNLKVPKLLLNLQRNNRSGNW